MVTRQLPRALSSLRVRTNIFHQKILAKGWLQLLMKTGVLRIFAALLRLALPHPSASMEDGCTALSFLMSFSLLSHQPCPR